MDDYLIITITNGSKIIPTLLIESIAWEARWKNLRWQGDRRLWRNRAQAEVLRACPKRQKAGD
jgi:hypothetical protein